MDRERLDKIIEILNEYEEAEDINKLCLAMGKKPLPDEIIERIKEDENFAIEVIKKLISNIEEQLKVEDEDYFYDNLDESYILFTGNVKKKVKVIETTKYKDIKDEILKDFLEQSEEKRIKLLDMLTGDEYKTVIIKSLSEEKRIEFLDKISNESLRADIVRELSEDKYKVDSLDKISNESLRADIVRDLSEDKYKVDLLDTFQTKELQGHIISSIKNPDTLFKCLDVISNFNEIMSIDKIYIIRKLSKGLTDDNKKIALLKKFQKGDILNNNTIETILKSLKDNNLKIEYLDYLDDKLNFILKEFTTDELKIAAFRKLDDKEKAFLIINLTETPEEEKIELLKDIEDEESRTIVIEKSLEDDRNKLELLDTISNNTYKERIIRTINKQANSSFIKENRDREDIDIFLRYTILDNEILDIIGERYSLDNEQKQIITQLYKKNDELLETINYKILEEKYAELRDKLEILTCYEDIQEKICELDDNSYSIFIKSLKLRDQKNNEWIKFTDKVISNLYNKEYQQLIENIKDKELSDEEIESVASILCKENIFNITTLDEAKRYEEIKNEVCDIIINNPNSEYLDRYPKISSMPELDRLKLAVLQKIYGQTLKESDRLIRLYGADIENLEINDDNEDVIQYIRSLKVIKNTRNVELLKSIYEKAESIQIDDIYDIETIENDLNNAYLETFNKKLYQPKEEDLVKVEKVDGKEVLVYDAGTDFSISLTSIGAYCRNDTESGYVEDWNRPKIASQGFCTSYIRNDMLATAPIKNVAYGFSSYDRGTLMASNTIDMFSNARRFRATAARRNAILYRRYNDRSY